MIRKDVRKRIELPFITMISMAALIVLPAAQVDAAMLVDDIIPSVQQPVSQSEENPNQSVTPDASPIIEDVDETAGSDDVVSAAPVLDIMSEPSLPVVNTVQEVTVPLTEQIQQPVAMAVAANASIQASGAKSPRTISTQRVVTPARSSTLTARNPIVQPANVVLRQPTEGTRIAVAQPAKVNITTQPAYSDSGVTYKSNQIGPDAAKRYYQTALLIGGLGALLYGTTFLSRLPLFSSLFGRSLRIR
jgi:hypothetical protein